MINNIESKAFIQLFELPPYRSGTLSGLTFGVKDLIDIAGYKTGGGNPTWENSHPPAICHAICVEQLLSYLGSSSLLCMPTAALLAPKKGLVAINPSESYYRQAPSFTPIAGLASLPQLSLPYGYSRTGVPVGISFLASHWNDELLFQAFNRSLPSST
ncbi:MAG: hypothetical protein JSR46_03070 [Verrucomicrobia bacterium]|nr:hypothetical protein [Verrucomicrobiota bacterium]